MSAFRTFKALLRRARARVLFSRGDFVAALASMQEAEAYAPLPPAYHVFKAMVLTRSGRHEEAHGLLRSTIDEYMSVGDPEARYAVNYAQILLALADDNFEIAEPLFERAKSISVSSLTRRVLPLSIRPSVRWARRR